MAFSSSVLSFNCEKISFLAQRTSSAKFYANELPISVELTKLVFTFAKIGRVAESAFPKTLWTWLLAI